MSAAAGRGDTLSKQPTSEKVPAPEFTDHG
jgi:hypothetical protein